MPDVITIRSQSVQPGESVQVNLNIARLPSHTVIDLPVNVYRGPRRGPVLLLTAGLHGDELNGIEILRRMVVDGLVKPTAGTVIAIPVVNIYGFLHASRDLPDGKDLNRSFPGSKTGSLARRIAYVLVKEILPHIDYGIDFHTGGASRTNFPQARCVFDDPVCLRLAKAFGAPFTLNSRVIDKSFRKYAAKRGKKVIVYEGGESSRFDERAIVGGINGSIRLMRFLKMTDAAAPRSTTKLLRKSRWVRARYSGLFRALIECGAKITEDQLLGTITDPFGETEYKVRAPLSGYVIGLNNQPVITQGDALFHVGF